MATLQDKLLTKLSQLDDLPTLPGIVFELERALVDEATGATEVALIIEEDPSMTANVLRAANSVLYISSTSGTIGTVKEAVARVGFREVRRLVTAAALIQTFAQVGKHLDHRRFWAHSLRAAVGARAICQHAKSTTLLGEDEAYVSGLLHDIGLLIFDQYFPDVFSEIQTVADEQKTSYVEAERSVLGMDHAEIGGRFLDLSNLPGDVVAAAMWHNQPERAEAAYRGLAEVVCLAETVCTALEAEDDGSDLAEALCAKAWEGLGLAADGMRAIIKSIQTESQSYISFLI